MAQKCDNTMELWDLIKVVEIPHTKIKETQ